MGNLKQVEKIWGTRKGRPPLKATLSFTRLYKFTSLGCCSYRGNWKIRQRNVKRKRGRSEEIVQVKSTDVFIPLGVGSPGFGAGAAAPPAWDGSRACSGASLLVKQK